MSLFGCEWWLEAWRALIVGTTNLEQLQDAIAAMALTLTPEVGMALEAPYRPRAVAGIC